MDRTGGKISGPQSLHQLTKIPNAYIVLRTSKLVEIVGPAQDKFLKPLATINLPKSPTFFGNFCKSVKIDHFSCEIIFGQLL